MLKTIIIGLILTFLTLAALSFLDPKIGGVFQQNSQSTTLSANAISVSIRGEIVHEGNYVMEQGDTLDDLINAAGGITENADQKAYNGSYVLANEESYYIAKIAMESDACIVETISKVNINTASKEELMSVNGIGSTIATAIIDYRQINGPFYRLEDLMKVSGIGNATFEKIKDYVTLS